MPQPSHIYAFDAENFLSVHNTFRRLHEGDHEGALVLLLHLLNDVAGAIVIMGDTEAQASDPLRPIPTPFGEIFCLFPRLDHRRHDAHGTGVQDRRNQMIRNPWNPHDRRYARATRERHLGFQDVEADAPVLHVEDDELGPCIAGDLAEPRGEELRRHDAVHGVSLS